MPLTDFAIKRLAAKNTVYRVADGKGLALLVHPNGSKYWQLRYRFDGRAKTLALGVYPEVTLAQARERQLDARKQIASGVNPSEVRKLHKETRAAVVANSLQVIAEEWYCLQKASWSESHCVRAWRLLSKDLFPWLGNRPVSEIKPSELLTSLRRIEKRGAKDTAARARQIAGQVFRFAIASGRAERDPSQDLRGALAPTMVIHRAAIIEPKEVGQLLLTLDSYHGSPIVRTALKLAPLTFVRPGELRKAQWHEINFDTAEWRISSVRMKMRQPHIVPLSTQALAILRELYPLTGPDGYLFPSPRESTRAMSDNAVLAAMRRLGIEKDEMCGHGFRAMARTILDEVLNYRVDWIEHQLAHAVRDVNGRAYNRTSHLAGRRQMMQGWADYLDLLREQASGRNVIQIQPNS